MHDPAVARRYQERAAAQADQLKADRDRLSTFLISCMIAVFVLVAGVGFIATRDYVWLLYAAVTFLAGSFVCSGIVFYRYPKPRAPRRP